MNMLRLLMALAGTKRSVGLGNLLLQPLLLRLFRRTPMGMVAIFLLRKGLADERLFGMDLASRRNARLAWLGRLLAQHGLSSPLDSQHRSAAKR